LQDALHTFIFDIFDVIKRGLLRICAFRNEISVHVSMRDCILYDLTLRHLRSGRVSWSGRNSDTVVIHQAFLPSFFSDFRIPMIKEAKYDPLLQIWLVMDREFAGMLLYAFAFI